MKTLLLVRHASSDCDDMSLADRFRPLDRRGERELDWLARTGRERGGLLQLIVSSPALRAMATAQALAEAAGLRAGEVRVDDRLYDGGSRRLLDVVAELDDTIAHAAVVGHNPELSALGRHFCATISHLPSAGIAMLSFDASSWRDAVSQRAAHAVLDAPRLPHGPLPASVSPLVAVGGHMPPVGAAR